ncbi:allantoinase [Enterococcus sp. DIV1279b]|nr:allantoinase [Enterococcus casseliflavus ATCC 49996]EOU10336.1 allantoinase [Enterococcus casseliflavus ATCC 49996]
MSHDLVIKNGLVILENGEVETDVAVKDGIISAIGKDLTGAQTIDASGLVVSPGMLDAHVHITDPGGGYRDHW